MSDNKGLPPEGLDEFLTSDDPQSAVAAQGFQQLAEQPAVAQALDFGANLDAHQAMVQSAMAGDPQAQLNLAQHNLGSAMGSLAPVAGTPGAIIVDEGILPAAQSAYGTTAPAQSAGYLDKAAQATQLADNAALNQQQVAAATSRKSAELDKLARLELQKKAVRNKQRFAEGGIVAPAGLDAFLKDSPPSEEPATPPGRSPASTPPQSASVASSPPGLDDFIAPEVKEEKYGSTGQQALTALEGAASAATFGASTGAETALGVNPEDIQARREANPTTHMLGQGAGLIGSSLIPGVGAANLIERAGAGAAEAVGLGAAENLLPKIGSAAVKGAVDNSLFQAGDEVSKAFSSDRDPAEAAQSALVDIGLSGLIGGTVSGGFGAVSPLWKATMGAKTDGLLKAITNRLGGVEGDVADDTVQQALVKSGLSDSIAPEIRASLSSDPAIKNLASVLEQTDTNASGIEFQKVAKSFRNDVSRVQADALKLDPESLPTKGAVDRYETGREVGETLSKEIDNVISPLSKEYDKVRAKSSGVDLDPSISNKAETFAKAEDKAFGTLQKTQKELQKALRSNSPEAAIAAQAKLGEAEVALKTVQKAAKTPGTTDMLAQKIGERAQQEGWLASPSSEIMAEVNRVMKELPNLKTLKDLSQYITTVGDNTASKLPFGMQTPVSRAGGIMKSILRDAEGELLGSHIGSEEGADALAKYAQLRKDYAAAAQLKDQVSETLGLKASTSGFAKALKSMAASDGEGVINKLSGTKDAAWLRLLQEKFPQTAELIKKYHLEQLGAAANVGGELSSAKLITALEKMSPQLREFAVGAEAEGKVKAAHSILERLNDTNHNFSNTGRTVDKLLGGMPGSVIGLITSLETHSGIAGLLAGSLTKTLGKDIPDAGRLALLKFLGSSSKIDSGGFKAMSEYIQAVTKGVKATSSAVGNVFKAGREVLPESFIPKESDRKKLDKQLKSLQENPTPLQDTGGKTSHYLPEHGQALGATAAGAVAYLNGERPKSYRPSPLDKEIPPSKAQQATYDRTLDVAQQPLIVLQHIKNGTILPQDVATVKTLYPALYKTISQKLLSEMNTAVNKEQPIPYNTRVGLSMFLMQPLDSTMTPLSIQTIQSTFALPGNRPGDQSAQPPTAGQGPKHSMNALNKLPGMYQTPGQARASKRLKDS